MKKIITALLTVVAITLLSQCKTDDTKTTSSSEYDSIIVEFNSMFGVKNNLKSISEVMIYSGVLYQEELTVDTAQKAAYTANDVAAAMYCGVFSADALYHATFNNGEASFASYTAAQILANKIGIGPYYVEHLLKRGQSGLTEKDSLLTKFNEVLTTFDTTLAEEQRFKIISSYLIGNIIEKLYLIDKGLATLENKPISEISKQDKFLFQLLISEEKSVDLFVDLLNKYSENKGSEFHVEMLSLQALYKELSAKGIPDYAQEKSYVPTIEMKNISSQIEHIRNMIIAE